MTFYPASTEIVVLTYVRSDGRPGSFVVESLEEDGSGEMVVTLPGGEGSALWTAGPDRPVTLLYIDPARPGFAHKATGIGRLTADGRLGVVLEGAAVVKPVAARTGCTGKAAAARILLEVTGLDICYGSKQAVRNLALDVRQGEIFGLLGPNGAGKTSTLSAIEGLRKATSGEIRLDGTDVLRHPIEAKAKMGVQLQATSFQSSLNLTQILRLFAGLYGMKVTQGDLDRMISDVGLASEVTKPFKQLSGGQQQRLSLQVAVIHRPALLLLDEPTAGLDPQARRQLWDRIERLRQEGGSILLTTHSMEEAQAVCDRVAIMDHGEILTCGPPSELIALHRNDPRVQAVAHGHVTLDDVFIGLTGSAIRD